MFNSLNIFAGFALVLGSGHVTQTEDLTFKGGGGQMLVGTFESPVGQGPFAAVLLIPGSGPTDRDGNSILLKAKVDTLKQIADVLAEKGIASFRFDKRAILRYSADWPKTVPELNTYFSYRHFIEDAEAAFSAMQAHPGVDAKRCGMLGHSEGALYTMQIASELTPPPAAIVTVGGAGRTIGVVLREQVAAGLAKQTAIDPKPLLAYIDAANTALMAGKPLPPNVPQLLAGLYNPAYLDLLTAYTQVDPTKLAAMYPGPALVINGADDTQVSPTEDAPLLVKAFKSRKSGAVEFHIIPKASHNLKSTADGNNNAVVGPVDPGAMKIIVTWLAKNLG